MTLEVFHFEISGNANKDRQLAKIELKLVTLEVSHFKYLELKIKYNKQISHSYPLL